MTTWARMSLADLIALSMLSLAIWAACLLTCTTTPESETPATLPQQALEFEDEETSLETKRKWTRER